MYKNSIVVWDLETTALIDKKLVPLEKMSISVGCALIMDFDLALSEPDRALEQAEKRSYWHAEAIAKDESKRPLSELAELLASARLNVAYNGRGFDILVMKQHFADLESFATAERRLFDPLHQISGQLGWFKLATLLASNNIPGKSGKGADAPSQWHRGELVELESYCAVDVDRLARLILQQTLKLPLMLARVPLGTLYGLVEEGNQLVAV